MSCYTIGYSLVHVPICTSTFVVHVHVFTVKILCFASICMGDFELSQLNCLSSSVVEQHLERGFISHLSAAPGKKTICVVLCCVVLLCHSECPTCHVYILYMYMYLLFCVRIPVCIDSRSTVYCDYYVIVVCCLLFVVQVYGAMGNCHVGWNSTIWLHLH